MEGTDPLSMLMSCCWYNKSSRSVGNPRSISDLNIFKNLK